MASEIPTLQELQEEERSVKATATDTLYHMARQLLSVAGIEHTRGRVEAVVGDLAGVVAEYLDISFTEKELIGVTAKLYAFLLEAGVIS